MAHVIFATYGHKSAHDKIQTEINNWRYEIEGEKRQGPVAPIISEIKFYDVRIQKEALPKFMRDMQFQFMNQPRQKNFFLRMMQRILKVLRWSVGMKSPTPAPGPNEYTLNVSWQYSFLIGVLDDDVQKDEVTGTKREVL